MSADLTAAIRTALRSDEIEATNLRQLTLRDIPRKPRRAHRCLVVVAVAMAIVAVVVVVCVAATAHHSESTSTAMGSTIGFVGFHWRVSRIEDAQGEFSLPRPFEAEIVFTCDGHVLGGDTLNSLSGRYRKVPGGYRVSDVVQTAVGYAGDDPTRGRTIEAIDRMFFTVGDASGPELSSVRVGVQLDGDVLIVSRGGTVLTLTRAAAAREGCAVTPPTPPR